MIPDDMLQAVELGREALMITLKLSLPLLLVGLVVGLIVSVLQAATQLQEQTLSFIPKIVAVVVVLFIALPWFLAQIIDYTEELFLKMGTIFPTVTAAAGG